jgi:pyruvate/2-oxoglutarate dehydrogenase complex dihydrolipoamide dehydrogenase (E3) component
VRRLHLDRYRASGAELIMGDARFTAPRTVDVQLAEGGARRISGDRVFLNLGTHATVPELPGLAAAEPMTHVELLGLDRRPEHLVVIGGGYVGLELAQAMRRFGSHVTVIERGPQLAGSEDPDVAAAVLELFRDEGITVLLQTRVQSVEGKIRARGTRAHDGTGRRRSHHRYGSARRRGPHPEHGGDRAGTGWGGADRSRLPQGRRAPGIFTHPTIAELVFLLSGTPASPPP